MDINKEASGVYSVAASPQLFLSLMTRVVRVFVAGRCCAYRATECASRTIVTGQERERESERRGRGLTGDQIWLLTTLFGSALMVY